VADASVNSAQDRYRNPLVERYASDEMSRIFSDGYKFRTWRRLWLALAETQRELGLAIPDAALDQMRERIETIDLQRAAEHERRLRHDVMAHVHHFAEVAPAARGIIHLGATSAFVTDNTELLQHRDALALVRRRLVSCIGALAAFAREHRDVATLGYTHFQTAQPTTVGKRAALWISCWTWRRSSTGWPRCGSAARAARRVPRPRSSSCSTVIPRASMR
jgi:adenylosuccinate lyase